jgi:GT2 family glycosyltransferase
VHNRVKTTLECLNCLAKQIYQDYQIIVVDDGSTDDTAEIIRQKFPQVRILRGDGNLWWTGAMHKGVAYILKHAKEKDFILSLNDDVIFDHNFLNILYNTSIKHERAIVGALCRDFNNKNKVLESGVKVNWEKYSYYQIPLDSNKDVTTNLDTFSGWGTLIPIEVFNKIGNFAYKFFPHYGGDFDFGFRAKAAGFNIIISNKAVVYVKTELSGYRPNNAVLSYKNYMRRMFSIKSPSNILVQLRIIYRNCPNIFFKIFNIFYVILGSLYLFVKNFISYSIIKVKKSILKRMSWKAIKCFINEHYVFIILLSIIAIILIILNPIIWPVNDEYYYAIIGKAIYSSIFEKTIFLGDLNTEHTPLVAFIIAAAYAFFKIDSISQLRFISIIASLGSVILFYSIFLQLGIKKKIVVLLLGLLFLIPDFWVYSVRLTLEMPLLFSFTLLIYLLIKKSSLVKISLALFLILWVKEYYFYMAGGCLGLYYGITILILNNKYPWTGIKKFVQTLIILFLPSLLMIFLFIDLNILPYPRLLELSMKDLFGDLFLFIQQIIKKLLYSADVIRINSFSGSFIDESTRAVDAIQYTGAIPRGIFNSPIAERTANFVQAYTFNFCDIFINPLFLVFSLVGFCYRTLFIYKNRKFFDKIRIDIIFIILFLTFIFFNVQQGGTMHGFRILLPMVLSLTFYSYYGFLILLNNPNRKKIILATIIFFLLIFIYLSNVLLFAYESTLTNTGLIKTILRYKPYIFSLGFLFFFLFVILYSRIRLKQKYKIMFLLFMVVCFWAIRFVPYYFNNNLNINYFGYDYSLPEAQPYLESIKGKGLITNLYFHKTHYLTNNIQLENDFINPTNRIFLEKFPQVNFGINNDYNPPNLIKPANNKAEYVFLYQEFYGEKYTNAMREFEKKYEPYLKLVKEYKVNNKQQWVLYKFDYKKYLEDQGENI